MGKPGLIALVAIPAIVLIIALIWYRKRRRCRERRCARSQPSHVVITTGHVHSLQQHPTAPPAGSFPPPFLPTAQAGGLPPYPTGPPSSSQFASSPSNGMAGTPGANPLPILSPFVPSGGVNDPPPPYPGLDSDKPESYKYQ